MQSENGRFSTDKILAVLLDMVHGLLDREVSAEENFFHIGGDSLTAVKLLMRLEMVLGKEIDTEIFFDTENFAEVARALAQDRPAEIRID